MKKLLSIIVIPLLLLSCSSKESRDSYSDELDKTFSFTLLEDGTYGISAKNKEISGDIIIPDFYRGKKVTQIVDEGFLNCTKITGVNIGANVSIIGKDSFQSAGEYNQLSIPNNVVEIKELAFHCTRINSLFLGNGVKRVGKSAFSSCYLKELLLGESVEFLGRGAFSNNYVENLLLPASLKEIEPSTFGGFYSLNNVDIDKNNIAFKVKENALFDYYLRD